MSFKAIRLLATCMIAGLPRSPAEGVQTVPEDEALRLIEAGQAVDADQDVEGAGLGDTSTGGNAFDAGKFVGRKVEDISDEDIAALSADDRDAVVAAEKAGKNRSTLLDRLQPSND